MFPFQDKYMAKLTDILTGIKAYAYSTYAHRGQERKFTGDPYIVHPRRVRERLYKFGVRDPDVLAAALLHDTLEDTETSYGMISKFFNRRVADIVQWLTNPEGKKAEHIRQVIRNAPYEVVVIKVMDRIDNLNDGGNASFLANYKGTSTIILQELEKRGFSKLYAEYLRVYNSIYD